MPLWRVSLDESIGDLGFSNAELREFIDMNRDLPDCWDLAQGSWDECSGPSRFTEEAAQESLVRGVDAGRTSNNAADRCAGFAIDLAHNPRNKHFAEDIKGNTEEPHINQEGLAYIRQAVEKLGVECDWSPEGKYHSPATADGEANLRKFAQSIDNLNQRYSWVETKEIQAITGSRHYRKALFAPGTVLMQPVKFMYNAARKLPENCTVYEETPITAVSYSAGTHNSNTRHVRATPRGVIRARKIYLCNTGLPAEAVRVAGRVHGLVNTAGIRPLLPSLPVTARPSCAVHKWKLPALKPSLETLRTA